MADLQLDLSDIQLTQKKNSSSNRWYIFLLLLILLVQGVIAYLLWRQPVEQSAAALTAEQTLALAQKLESLDVFPEAAQAWQQYLEMTKPDAEKAAKLWYRIASIQQDGRLYDEAIASYARSQAMHKVAILEPEIARRTQTCLEQLGLFSALQRDIRQRTDLAPDGSSKSQQAEVLAEIGAWKITRSDYERSLAQQVEASLGMLPAGSDGGELHRRKKALLQKLNDPKTFPEQFQQFIVGELLYREAREQKLAEKQEFQSFMRLSERRYLEQSLLNTLPLPDISDAEVQFYYEKHPDEFQQDGNSQPLAEVAANIRQELFQQKRQESQQKFIKSLIDKYDVVYHTARLPEPENSIEEKK